MSTPEMICYWCREAPAVLCRNADGSILTLCEECRIVSDWPIAQPESAAPDLLEALKALAGTYDRRPCFCEMSVGNPMVKDHSSKCVAARFAIEKAEGR